MTGVGLDAELSEAAIASDPKRADRGRPQAAADQPTTVQDTITPRNDGCTTMTGVGLEPTTYGLKVRCSPS